MKKINVRQNSLNVSFHVCPNHKITVPTFGQITMSGFGKNMDGYGLVEACHLCSPNKILYLQMLPVYIYPAYSVDILLIICPHHSNHMS